MKENIFIQYLQWHFFDSTKRLLTIWNNFLRFNLNYWSLPLLLKTLFSPWRRYQSSYGKGFDIGRFFEVFTFNTISRVMGFLMRAGLIVFGLLTEVVVVSAGLVILFAWLFLPLLILGSFYYGIRIFF